MIEISLCSLSALPLETSQEDERKKERVFKQLLLWAEVEPTGVFVVVVLFSSCLSQGLST